MPRRRGSEPRVSVRTSPRGSPSAAAPLKRKMTSFDQLEVGKRYVCYGGDWGNASKTEAGKKKTYIGELLALRAEKAYLHFVGLDKRLDEWVTLERILFEEYDEDTAQDDVQHRSGNGRSGMKRRLDGGEGKPGIKSNKAKKTSASSRHSVHSHGHHDPKTKVRNVQSVRFGNYMIDPWYYSPFPGKYGENVETLFICEYTFKYMLELEKLQKHTLSCPKQPPGKMIYRDDNRKIAAFEIIGGEHPVYCQNLCLFAKLFIEHKTLYYDVDPFKFYVVTEFDDIGHHPVAYYSKENNSSEKYNLACILTFPPHQRKGYGRLLMSLSYKMSKREGMLGSPEKPLSDLGKISYRSFWTFSILSFLRSQRPGNVPCLDDIIKETGFKREDIVSTIHHLGMLKHWKGQYVLHYSRSMLDKTLKSYDRKRFGESFCKDEYFLFEDEGITMTSSE
jgi:hypothetical protein|eukprot:g4271.t1